MNIPPANFSAVPAASSRPTPVSNHEQTQRLSDAQLNQLSQLKARDQEVRAHEAAHQAAGGKHAGAMSLTYERGPDGVQYAVAGEVSISMSAVSGDPQATIDKMRTVRAAAMAPAEPSSTDRAVAAQAMQTLLQAQGDLAELAAEESLGARRARETYASVAAFDDENSAFAKSSLAISV